MPNAVNRSPTSRTNHDRPRADGALPGLRPDAKSLMWMEERTSFDRLRMLLEATLEHRDEFANVRSWIPFRVGRNPTSQHPEPVEGRALFHPHQHSGHSPSGLLLGIRQKIGRGFGRRSEGDGLRWANLTPGYRRAPLRILGEGLLTMNRVRNASAEPIFMGEPPGSLVLTQASQRLRHALAAGTRERRRFVVPGQDLLVF